MEHKALIQQVELFPGVAIPAFNTIPSLNAINKNGSIVYITDGPLQVGDTVEPAFIKKRTIIKVKESRPAMGDWSGKSYLGMKPFYNLVEATL